MKMVVLGATAPKCDKKPSNPTSTSVVGTMVGSRAGTKPGQVRDAVVDAQHCPQYQGLLEAPKLSEIFDHQLIKANPETNNSFHLGSALTNPTINRTRSQQAGAKAPKFGLSSLNAQAAATHLNGSFEKNGGVYFPQVVNAAGQAVK